MTEQNKPQKQRDAHASKEAILAAAEAQFMARGFAGAAIRDIAADAAVTKSLIHHYFPSKDLLWAAVKGRRINAYFDVQLQLLKAVSGSRQLLADSLKAYFAYLKANPELVRLLSWASAEGDENFGVHQEVIALGIERVREAQAKHEIRNDVAPIHILYLFVGMTTHWFQCKAHFLSWEGKSLSDEPGDHDQQFLESFSNILIDGLKPIAAKAE